MRRAVVAAGVAISLVWMAFPASAGEARATTGHRSTHYLLDHLRVGSTYHSGYERSMFPLWSPHPDGCNTRYKVLIRDAVRKPTVESGCYLSDGKWVSPYDGYSTTDPTDMQIDHVVPLAVAWGSGAWRWTTATRKAFANDLGTSYDLLAVSAHANESKGDDGPDEYLPPKKSFDCRYMADYTAVLWRWRLAIDPSQKKFLTSHLKVCGWPSIATPPRPSITDAKQGQSMSGRQATGIRITSIYFDSPGSDTGSNTSLNHEWVEITNTSGKAGNLTGWVLHDASGHDYDFPSFALASKASVKVHTGSGKNTAHNLYWGESSYIWNNTGDTATLVNAGGKTEDSCRYTETQDPEATC